ncbi:MAG: Sodium/potassium-transporting ATPase subunit alpha-1 [Marteilia pararefringens]
MAIVKDDNIMGLVSAVKESRQLRDNTLKGIAYMSRSLLQEMFPTLLMFFFNTVTINLASIMIINDILLSMIPSVAKAFEKTESDIMKIRPEKLREKTATSYAYFALNQYT